ncbi:MAG: hypothetical protein QME78_09835, partial [Thermodesulfobacteriota bacterium]|nr:hypothetical protein [Thermodesulfobacteriota bacterium]
INQASANGQTQLNFVVIEKYNPAIGEIIEVFFGSFPSFLSLILEKGAMHFTQLINRQRIELIRF